MCPVIVTYLTWKEIFGERPTEEELLTEIRQFDRLNTVWLLARINLLLNIERIHSEEEMTVQIQTFLVNLFIDDDLFERLKMKVGTERLVKRQLFHSLQMLTLIRSVVLHGAIAGGSRPDIDKTAALRLGRCLAFIRDVNRKFGSDKGAGVEQLVRKMSALFGEKRRRSLKEINSSGAKTIIPILVVQESFVSSEITASYLVDIFGTLRRKEQLVRGISFTFPLVLDIAEIEILRPYLAAGKVSFVDCMMERVRMGSRGILSFRDFFSQYLLERKIESVKDDETVSRYLMIMERISQRFFKKSFSVQNSPFSQ